MEFQLKSVDELLGSDWRTLADYFEGPGWARTWALYHEGAAQGLEAVQAAMLADPVVLEGLESATVAIYRDMSQAIFQSLTCEEKLSLIGPMVDSVSKHGVTLYSFIERIEARLSKPTQRRSRKRKSGRRSRKR